MTKVELYVYDLSRGMAKQMSLALTGKQIDGIWHTSVVVYGREIFYGQGILESRPGATHHGQPVQILDMGETQIDEDTFNEYLASLAEQYTADAYHLIEFNCNNFTADVVGFLTGRETPSWITEFLATPFGQMLKPQIDAMFRSRSSTEHRVNPGFGSATPAAAATPPISTPLSSVATPATSLNTTALLNSIAASATAGSSASQPTAAPVSPLVLVSSSANFDSLLKEHHLVVNFTNTPGCPPCRVIKPIYESIASEYATFAGRSPGLRFLEIELGVGQGREIASRYGVSATPTFMFFRGGKKVEELRGASKKDLEVKVEQFVENTWPRHPHRTVYLPVTEKLPISPITNSAIPNYNALIGKLDGFVSLAGSSEVAILKSKSIPMLEGKGSAESFSTFVSATTALLDQLKAEESFPLIDLWRIAILQPGIVTPLAAAHTLSPIDRIIQLGASTLATGGSTAPRPFLLTILRLITNLLASLPLANIALSTLHLNAIISIAVESLLHTDQTVRSAAAAVAVNLSNYRHRLAKSLNKPAEEMEEAEWETELLSAEIEAIGREEDEDVAHRLLVSISQLMYLNKGIEGMQEMMQVLEGAGTIRGKKWKGKDVVKLREEVVSKLISS